MRDPLSGRGEHHVVVRGDGIRMSKRYGHIGNQTLRAAADVLAGVETPAESLKESPRSLEVENVFIQ